MRIHQSFEYDLPTNFACLPGPFLVHCLKMVPHSVFSDFDRTYFAFKSLAASFQVTRIGVPVSRLKAAFVTYQVLSMVRGQMVDQGCLIFEPIVATGHTAHMLAMPLVVNIFPMAHPHVVLFSGQCAPCSP